jgi:hypothetical protein
LQQRVLAVGRTRAVGSAAVKVANPNGMTQVRYKRRRVQARVQQSRDWGPFGAPFAAAAGVGAATGPVVGGTAAALTGDPYDPP